MRFLSTLSIVLLSTSLVHVQAQQPCNVVTLSNGDVCQCDASSCDTIAPLGTLDESTIALYETEKNQHHYLTKFSKSWSKNFGLLWGLQGPLQSIQINAKTTYQTITGFGGAFTDAAALTWASMTQDVQKLLIDQYYGPQGLGYTIGRIPITGSDFSTHSYSYDDVPNDFDLTHFNVSFDQNLKFPLIKQAISRSPQPIKFFGSAWSAPAWMKATGSPINGTLKGYPSPTDPYYNTWAQYYVKSIDAFQANGIPIWGVTTGNEPITGGGPGAHGGLGSLISSKTWDYQEMNLTTQIDWIKYNLGPALKQKYPNVNIIAWDDGNAIFDQVKTILADADAYKYIDGIGIHWYGSFEDLIPYFSKMTDVHNAYPDKWILPTEACEGFLPWSLGPKPGDWVRGMTYAHDILNDLNNWGVGWVDWNLMLNMQGGPNHVGNFVDSPILLDTVATNKFYKQPMYYALGHFAKFIPAGSQRVDIKVNFPAIGSALPIESTAFLTPDGNIVLVLINRDPLLQQSTALQDAKRGWLHVITPPASIQTIIYKNIPASATAKTNEADVINDTPVPQDATSTSPATTSSVSTGTVVMISALTSAGVLLIGVLIAGGIYYRMKRSTNHVEAMKHMHQTEMTTTSTVQV